MSSEAPKEQAKSTEEPAEAAQPTANESKSLGPFCISKALSELCDAARPHLSIEQLEFLGRATEHARLHALNMSKITLGLGLLIAEDENTESSSNSGCFDGETPTILFALANQLDYLAGLIELGSSAQFWLNHPDLHSETAQS
jgi:hypothetical protein